MMEDQNIPQVITQILNSYFVKYTGKMKHEKDMEKDANTKNQRRQLPENKNIKYFIYAYICKVKFCMSSIQANSQKLSIKGQSLKEIISLLMIAPFNKKSSKLVGILVNIKDINMISETLVELYKNGTTVLKKNYLLRLS